MDIKTRLFRRPFTTILWSVLVIAMTLLIGVGCVLNYSAQNLLVLLDESHKTIALRADRATEFTATENGTSWKYEDMIFTQEDMDYFLSLDSVKDVYFHSLTGGHIPELSPASGLDPRYSYRTEHFPGASESYDQFIFVGTVLRLWEEDEENIGYDTAEPRKQVFAQMQIEQIVTAHPDYPLNDTGAIRRTVNCVFHLTDRDAFGYFETGGTYLVCGEYDTNSLYGDLWPEDTTDPFITTYLYTLLENGYLQGSESGFYDGEFIGDVRPIAAKLEDSLEGFLEDSNNAEWVTYIETCENALHNMPVMGTEDLGSMYLFLSSDAFIVDGRMFSQEEYDAGSKVCIISETAANRSGAKVGDTLHISQFLCNEVHNRSLDMYRSDGMLNNPSVGEPMPELEYVTENEEFTVVGIYRQLNEWESTSNAFTPNTVFIPKNAQIPGGFGALSQKVEKAVTMGDWSGTVTYVKEKGAYGVYLSILLHNGMADDFMDSISQTQWKGKFRTFDLGYEDMISAATGVADSARKLLVFTACGWVVILALYVLLYQNSQRKNLGIMRSLGAKPKQARAFLFGGGFCLTSVSVILGTALTAVLTETINDKLLEYTLAQVAMLKHSAGVKMQEEVLTRMVARSQLPVYALILLGAAQLLVIAAVLWLHARGLSGKAPRKLLGV